MAPVEVVDSVEVTVSLAEVVASAVAVIVSVAEVVASVVGVTSSVAAVVASAVASAVTSAVEAVIALDSVATAVDELGDEADGGAAHATKVNIAVSETHKIENLRIGCNTANSLKPSQTSIRPFGYR